MIFGISLSRTRHRLLACAGLFAVVFAQLAVSAYACPMLVGAIAHVQAAETPPPCHDMDKGGQPALCEQHCENGQQNVGDFLSANDTHPFIAAFVVTLDAASPAVRESVFAPLHLRYPHLPPLTLRNCCLRI
jgi:hypothetical protein